MSKFKRALKLCRSFKLMILENEGNYLNWNQIKASRQTKFGVNKTND
jgi:hypothetical protein